MYRLRGTPISKTAGLMALSLVVVLASSSTGLGEPPSRYDIADLTALENAFVDLAEQSRPCTVAIRTYYIHRHTDNRGSGFVRQPVSQGSGFVLDSNGYIATNMHVLDEANTFTVTLHNGAKYDAEVVGADIRSDLAVLRIDATDLPPTRWGDVTELRINQWAFAVGNPFGLANRAGNTSVTYGVISALNRHLTGRLSVNPLVQYYGNLIETSATINPGNSGGPLFNLSGELIGIVTAIETTSGVSEGHGFAIAADNNIRRILDLLKAGKTVHYGFLGVNVRDVERTASRRVSKPIQVRGAVITEIGIADGPAATAGLRPRDIVIEFAGIQVEDSDHLVRLVGFAPAGSQAEITYLRGKTKRTTLVTLGDRFELLGLNENRN